MYRISILCCLIIGMHTKPLLGKNTMNSIKNIIGKQGTLKTDGSTLKWESMKATDALLTKRVHQVSNLLIDTYVPMELEFARQYPEQVPDQFFLQSLTELFKEPQVDWQEAERQLRAVLTKFFNETDFALFSKPDDICILVVAKENDIIRGMIQFLITPDYETGTVKAGFYAADKSTEKLLMASVFRILPETKRLFLHTRSTNEAALNLYRSWGFTQFEGPLPYWTDMEYLADKKSDLQDLTKTL